MTSISGQAKSLFWVEKMLARFLEIFSIIGFKKTGDNHMPSVFDVAKYILNNQCPKEGGSITTWKLQKLVYYAKAWHAAWEDEELFPEKIKAWANGPVCPQLYHEHKGEFKISSISRGDVSALTDNQKDSIDKVIEYYGKFEPHYLSKLTHAEAPWKIARGDLRPEERGENEITTDLMVEYYSAL